jgi:repressor LexA
MLTPLQHKICDYIEHFLQEHPYSPSLAEIARGIGISPKSVSLISRNIHALAKEGRLSLDKKGYRNIRLAPRESGELPGIPLVGRIAAGVPIEAIEEKQTLDLNSLWQPAGHYMLEVRGDSMIDEGILDGDYVVCRQTERAQEGDIVVALIDQQEATLKRISWRVPDRITLIPANVAFKPKAYLPQHVEVQGVFVGLLRLKG